MAAVMSAITEVQEISQRDLPPLHKDIRIIGDVPGCDSIATVEIAIVLSEKLAPILNGRELPESILLGKTAQSRPTLDEIATGIFDFVKQGKVPRLKRVNSMDSSEGSSNNDIRLDFGSAIDTLRNPKDSLELRIAARAEIPTQEIISRSLNSLSTPPPSSFQNENESENIARNEHHHE